MKDRKVAADEAGSTSEGQGASWHTSGGVLGAAYLLVSVVDASGGQNGWACKATDVVAEMWIKCHEGIHTFAV